MINNPQISVILSTYNPGKVKFECAINSIINQSFTSWELIVYDDGSKKDVSEYIRQITSKDKRIIYVKGHENFGVAYGLNRCIELSKGEYVARMDDDDISLPARLEKQRKFLENNHEYAWVGTLADLFDENGVWGIADRVEIPVKKDYLHSSPFIHPSVMFRKSVFSNENYYNCSQETSRCEDYELFMRLFAKGYKGYNMQEVLLQYRDDRELLKRKWKYSYYEMLVRINGFKRMNCLTISTIPYVVKPLIVCFFSLFPRTAQRIRLKGKKGDHIVNNT